MSFLGTRLPKDFQDLVDWQRSWRRLALYYTILHYVIGISALLLAALSASGLLEGVAARLVSFASAGCSALLTFVAFQAKGRAYRKAALEVQPFITPYVSHIFNSERKKPSEVLTLFEDAHRKYLADL